MLKRTGWEQDERDDASALMPRYTRDNTVGQKEEDAEWRGSGVHFIFWGHSKAAKIST